MLTQCPECDLQVSDKAITCPHCGYPMNPDAVKKIRNTRRRKRLPNGFGQIAHLKGRNLRKPFRAAVTVGMDEYGKPIRRLLKPEAYFKTYNEAYTALVEYHKNPYDLSEDLTVRQVYEKWTDEYFENIAQSAVRNVTAAWRYCFSIYDMRVKDVRARHIKGCMEEGYVIKKEKKQYASANMKSRIKSLFNLLLDYALEYELVDRNYARTFNLSGNLIKEVENNRNGHMPYTDGEIDLLWKNVGKVDYVDILLIQCYSGWRPQELGLIELKNVDLENMTFQGGMKTDSGRNRIVPIHPKIYDLVKKRYDEAVELDSKYLLNCTDSVSHQNSCKLTYDKYKYRFEKIIKTLNLSKDHRPHDGRMHFATTAKKYKVDEYALKYFMGHNITDITEKIYTKREPEWYQEEMQKIK